MDLLREFFDIMDTGDFHILVGWCAMLLGVVSGAMIGLFFHKDDWAGGYASFRRRMLRLGHISFFGIGFINLMFGLTLQVITLDAFYTNLASYAFLIGVISMPLVCFLSAWHKPFRHLFPIPVLSVASGIVLVLMGWPFS